MMATLRIAYEGWFAGAKVVHFSHLTVSLRNKLASNSL